MIIDGIFVLFFLKFKMNLNGLNFILAIGLLLIINVESLYFHIRETERKCFIEEVPDDTLVVGEFWIGTLKTRLQLDSLSYKEELWFFFRQIQSPDIRQGLERLLANWQRYWHAR